MRKLPSAGALKDSMKKQEEDLKLLEEIASYDLAIKRANDRVKKYKELRDNLLSQAVTRKIGDLGTMALVCKSRVIRSIDSAAACSLLDRNIIERIAVFPIASVERAVGLELTERLTTRVSVDKWHVVDRRVPGELMSKNRVEEVPCTRKVRVIDRRDYRT
jgi:hypothetical protein